MKISEIVASVEALLVAHKDALVKVAIYAAVYLAGSHHLLSAAAKAILSHGK